MKTVDCRLKLAADPDFKAADRVVELSVTGGEKVRQGTWNMGSDARDPRMSIGVSEGVWAIGHSKESGWTMFFLPRGDTMILFELHNIGTHPMEQIGCGSSIGGDGWRQGPPESDINYIMSFGCA